jgi:hypothetical protein
MIIIAVILNPFDTVTGRTMVISMRGVACCDEKKLLTDLAQQ